MATCMLRICPYIVSNPTAASARWSRSQKQPPMAAAIFAFFDRPASPKGVMFQSRHTFFEVS